MVVLTMKIPTSNLIVNDKNVRVQKIVNERD